MAHTGHVPVEHTDGHVESVQVVVSDLLQFDQKLDRVIPMTFRDRVCLLLFIIFEILKQMCPQFLVLVRVEVVHTDARVVGLELPQFLVIILGVFWLRLVPLGLRSGHQEIVRIRTIYFVQRHFNV